MEGVVVCCLVSDPMDCSLPGSPVNRIPQEYWSGLAFLSPGDLPNPGIGPTSPEPACRFFTTGPPGKPAMEVNSSSDFPLGQIPQEGLLPTRPPDVTPTDTSLPCLSQTGEISEMGILQSDGKIISLFHLLKGMKPMAKFQL